MSFRNKSTDDPTSEKEGVMVALSKMPGSLVNKVLEGGK